MAGLESHHSGEFRKDFGNGYRAIFVETTHGVDWSRIDSPQTYRGSESPERVIGKRRLQSALREAQSYFKTRARK
ncbi:hypothetical protein EPO56_01555 [Patescibacteria group bacterium]|nr:MAG: hypothetical protein EPO56_01555 [Patescibacteria group bacterium]